MPAAVRLDAALRDIELKACLAEPLLNVMNFLNEVVAEFPSAISFAPGRPLDSLLGVEGHLDALRVYVEAAARAGDGDPATVWRDLGQYSRTIGMITEAVAAHLRLDEGIDVAPDAIIVTVGAQEAMAIVLAGLFDAREDILLASDPAYIGITGLARLLGIHVVPVPAADGGLEPDAVERAIAQASRTGRVRALYDIPDFNNPLGTSLPVATRLELLDLCRRHDVLMIEDNAYGMFAYDAARPPTMKSLDANGDVLYIGSFSKTLFPGLRLGYLVANQRVRSTGETLAVALSRVKSLLTVNTPPLLQAIAAGALLQAGGSLEPIVAPKRARYKQQRDAMLAALAERLGSGGHGVSWNSPAGGFFMTVTLPFEFGPAELRRCALEHGVIVCPMRFFCLGPGRTNQIRLSFSAVEPETINAGIERLAAFIRTEARRSD